LFQHRRDARRVMLNEVKHLGATAARVPEAEMLRWRSE
jgi:hypothetical protein